MSDSDQIYNFIRRGIDAQRSVDRIVEKHNSENKDHPTPENNPTHRIVKKKKLANPLNVHWRTDEEGFEYIMRTMFEMKGISNLSEAERKLWFTRGWKQRLEKMRGSHRKAGIPDEKFTHPSLRS